MVKLPINGDKSAVDLSHRGVLALIAPRVVAPVKEELLGSIVINEAFEPSHHSPIDQRVVFILRVKN